MRAVMGVLMAIILTVSFSICGLLSYWGYGYQQVGPAHAAAGDTVRDGSVGGPNITGGGVGVGK